MDINILSMVLSVVSIVVTLILGTIAVLFSFSFYKSSNSAMTQIGKSADIASTYSKEIGSELIKILRGKVSQESEEYIKEVIAKHLNVLADKIPGRDKEIIKKVKSDVLDQIDSYYRMATKQPSTIERKNEIVDALDLSRFIKRIDELESDNKFLSAKYLREKVFATEPYTIKLMQYAIDEGILIKYSLANPNRPNYPVTGVKLDRENSTVKNILRSQT